MGQRWKKVNCPQPPRVGGAGQSWEEALASTGAVISSGKRRWHLQMSFVAWGASDNDDEPRPQVNTPVLWLDIPARSVRKPVAITGIYCPAQFVMRPITAEGGLDYGTPITSFTLDQLHRDRPDVGITEITQRIWKMDNRASLPPTSKLPTAQRLLASAVAMASVRGEYLPALSAMNDSTEPQFVITSFRKGEASLHQKVERHQPTARSPEGLRRCWELHDQSTRNTWLASADHERIAKATGFAPNTVKKQLQIIYNMKENGEWE